MDMEKKLISFFTDICQLKSEDLRDVIKHSNLELILNNYIPDKDILFPEMNELKEEQKRKNKIVLNELSIFLTECNNARLNPLFFKGIFLAAMIYDDINVRKSKDIDILIDVEEFDVYREIYKKLGYEIKMTESELHDDYKEHLKNNHIIFNKYMENVTICFEVHASIINPPTLFKQDLTEIFKSGTYNINIIGLSPKILELEYNILFLMLHYYKHLPRTFGYMLIQNSIYLKLFNLHEIALLIKKYDDKIDWNKLLRISTDMKVVAYIHQVSLWINEIYGTIIPNNFLDILFKNISSSFMKEIFENGMGKYMWLFNILIQKNILSMQELVNKKLKLNLVNLINQSNNYLLINDKYINIERSYDNLSNFENNLGLVINNKSIKIYAKKNNSQHNFLIETNEFEFLFVIKNRVFYRRLELVHKNDKEIDIIMTSDLSGDDVCVLNRDNDVNYDLVLNIRGYEINFDISWEALNIECNSGTIALFNLHWTLDGSNIQSNCYKYKLYNTPNIWDFRKIGAIRF